MKDITTEIKEYKEQYDFLCNRVRDLEWELATIHLDNKIVTRNKIDMLQTEIDNYRENIGILFNKVEYAIQKNNKNRTD